MSGLLLSAPAMKSCLALFTPMDPLQQARLLCPWNSPGKNTGVDCHTLLQGIFLTQGLNSGLLHCRQIFYHLSHQGIYTTVKKNDKDLDVINKKQ